MRRRSSFMLSSLIAVASAACATDGRPVPLEDLSEAVSTVFCDRVFECYGPTERADVIDPTAVGDEISCTQVYTAALDEALEQTYRDVAAGRLRYDGEAVTRCLSEIEAASCGAIQIGFDYAGRTCMDAFVPATR